MKYYVQHRVEMDGSVYEPDGPNSVIDVSGSEAQRLLGLGAIGDAPPGAAKVQVNVGVPETEPAAEQPAAEEEEQAPKGAKGKAARRKK